MSALRRVHWTSIAAHLDVVVDLLLLRWSTKDVTVAGLSNESAHSRTLSGGAMDSLVVSVLWRGSGSLS